MLRHSYNSSSIPSVLDRLLDDQPEQTSEVHQNAQSTRELQKAVARDLEALLNTRQESIRPIASEYTEVDSSLITYGLPDFTSLSLLNPNHRTQIRYTVEQAIMRFEPRLKRVRVTLEPARDHDRALRFRVDAMLQTDPSPEPVTFDAALQLNTQQYVVRGLS